jgi:hypothetical protein
MSKESIRDWSPLAAAAVNRSIAASARAIGMPLSKRLEKSFLSSIKRQGFESKAEHDSVKCQNFGRTWAPSLKFLTAVCRFSTANIGSRLEAWDWFTTCTSLAVISTSPNAAGYAALSGLPSLLSSSLDYTFPVLSQDTEQGENFRADFRQMMSSYASSEDSSEDQLTGQASQSQDETSDPQSTFTESTIDTEPSTAGTTSISTTSRQPGADESSQSDRTSSIQGGTSLSAIQILLKGGSLAQVLSFSMAAKGSPDGVSAAAENTNPSAVAKGSQQPLLTPAPTTGEALSGVGLPLKCKAGATKTSERRVAQQDTASSGVNLALADPPNSSSLTLGEEASGQTGTTPTSGNAVLNVAATAIGQTPEALQARMFNWNANSVQPEANNFAFAVRLTGGGAQSAHGHPEAIQESGTGSSIDDLQSGIAAVAAAGQSSDKSAGEGAGSHTGEQGEPPIVAADLLPGESVSAQITTGSSSESVSDSVPASAIPPDSETPANTEPVRNVHLQLTGDNNQRVDIRMVEVAGEMRVSVRAGDTRLAETLQDHIPDLAKGLNQQSLRADIWTPRTESTSPANSSNLAGQNSFRGNDNSNQGGQQRQGNNRQQQNQPEWVDELENYSSLNTILRSN